MKKQWKVLISDLDGTLLKHDKTISKENLAAITELKNRGIYFVPSSGRGVSEMPEMLSNPDIRYVICSNGAVILDKETGAKNCACYTPEMTAVMLDLIREYDLFFVVHYDGKTYMDRAQQSPEIYREYSISDYYINAIREFAIDVDNLSEKLKEMEDIAMISVFFRRETEQEECRQRLLKTGMFLVAPAFFQNLEVFSIQAGKGNGAKRLSQMLEIEISDVIGVGDSPNDITMIEAVGLGLAVDNACDDLKKISDEVICANEEHAISYILSNYF